MINYEFVKEYFKSQGCELLEDAYVNARTKMRYYCSCGRESQIVWYSFKVGNRCRKCGNEKTSTTQTLSVDKVKTDFTARECELLDNYTHSRKPMSFRCCCGRIGNISYNNFMKGRLCKECGIAKRAGENHYEWQNDREKMVIRNRFRQLAYRIFKDIPHTRFATNEVTLQDNLGFSLEEFHQHLKSHSNWGTIQQGKWEIDHIWPVSAFVNAGICDLKLISGLDNLRVVPAVTNRRKSACYNPVAFVRWLEGKGVLL